MLSHAGVDVAATSGHCGATRLLIVDDDAAVRASLKFLFDSPRFAVSVAADAYEAQCILALGRVDVVLTDLHMPGGGRAWLDMLHDRYPGLRVIVLTAAVLPASERRQLTDNAVVVFSKPVASEVLFDAVDGGSLHPTRIVSKPQAMVKWA